MSAVNEVRSPGGDAGVAPYRQTMWLGFVPLLGLAVFFVATSWRKWPDALVDFGRELYIPWRIARGAVLYVDAIDIYGPLSHYINAALFAGFGPGLMVLVVANLVVFTAILALLYRLCCRAWGVAAGIAAGAVFVSVFGFSQLVGIGNYNYATPYAHETTHGVLVLLLLVATLAAWCETPTAGRSFAAGLFAGLTALLKPEILLVAVVLIAGAFAVCLRRNRESLTARTLGALAFGAVLPTAAFALYFALYLPWGQALQAACRGWLNLGSRRVVMKSQLGFLGFDQPWLHFCRQSIATAAACAVFGAIGLGAWGCERIEQRTLRWLPALGLAAVAAWFSCFHVPWMDVARCLPGLMLLYVGVCVIRIWRPIVTQASSLCSGTTQASSLCSGTERAKTHRRDACVTLGRVPCVPQRSGSLRLLLALTGLLLLARMILNVRISQFGYYQAAIAGVLVPAILIGELPEWLRLGRFGRVTVAAATLALVGPGVVHIASVSQALLRLKTNPIGQGADRFYAFPGEVSPIDGYVKMTVEALSQQPPGGTLLVLPDGLMLNYLARMDAPRGVVPNDDPDERTLQVLNRFPPGLIVLISRPLREFGIDTYGQTVDSGKRILDWIGPRYETAGKRGGNPLDSREFGVVILRRRGFR